MVYLQLLKHNSHLFYYKNKYECDFIEKSESGLNAVQACFELSEQNRMREIKGLKEAMAELKIENGQIITYNQEMEVEGVQVIPFWKYFFEE